MSSLPTLSATDPLLAALRTCQVQNQTWATTLHHDEAELTELMSLLADVPKQVSRPHLSGRAVVFCADLNQLRNRLHQLRTQFLCASGGCNSTAGGCSQLGNYQFLPGTFSQWRDEFSHLRDSSYQFLAGLIRLNVV
jgi:hypothetical protein